MKSKRAQQSSSVGQASSLPSSPPAPSSPTQDHLIEHLLHLWERDDLPLSVIAAELNLSLRDLLDLIRTPEVDALLTQMDQLLERRTRQTALAKSRRALITLEQVQTEAETDAQLTPITPQATKAHRDARTNRTQRRLAATVTLNQLKILKAPVPKVAPVSDRCREPQQARAA